MRCNILIYNPVESKHELKFQTKKTATSAVF